MKIAIVHNSYQLPGGEDVVSRRESDLLSRYGHEVVEYRRSNHEIDEMPRSKRLLMPLNVIWNSDSKRDFKKLLRQERPDVVHIHNTFMMISPSIYSACREEGVPVVQTLHNYRLLCPTATFYRDGRPCHDCERSLVHSVQHACYRGSRTQTASVALMLAWHRTAGTYAHLVDRFITLTQFSRSNFLRAGFDPAKIVSKPNFVDPDPGERRDDGSYALYIGRLSPEKGLPAVLDAWKSLSFDVPLKIAGSGPMLDQVQAAAATPGSSVEYLGQLPSDQVLQVMKGARMLIFPSELYENFPLSLCEAFACGVPVIASNMGAMTEIVHEGITGLMFEPGSASDLKNKVEFAWQNRDFMARLGRNCRREFEAKYTAAQNYRELVGIYESVLPGRQPESSPESETIHA